MKVGVGFAVVPIAGTALCRAVPLIFRVALPKIEQLAEHQSLARVHSLQSAWAE